MRAMLIVLLLAAFPLAASGQEFKIKQGFVIKNSCAQEKGCPCPDQGPCICKGSSCRCEEGCTCKICPANVAKPTTHPDWVQCQNAPWIRNLKTGMYWHPTYGHLTEAQAMAFNQPQTYTPSVYYQPAYQPMMFGGACAGGT